MLKASHSLPSEKSESDQVAVIHCLLRRTALLVIIGMIVFLIWGVASGPAPRDTTLSPPAEGPARGEVPLGDQSTSIANNAKN